MNNNSIYVSSTVSGWLSDGHWLLIRCGEGLDGLSPLDRLIHRTLEQHTDRSQALAHSQKYLSLVAHSAGPFLPAAIPSKPRQCLRVRGCGYPRDGSTRLDLMKWDDPGWAEQFQEGLSAVVSQTGALTTYDVIPDGPASR
jgi:hypothetical protein